MHIAVRVKQSPNTEASGRTARFGLLRDFGQIIPALEAAVGRLRPR